MCKKLIALLMAAMMLLSVAAACGKTDAPADNGNNNASGDNTSTNNTTTPDNTADAGKVYKTYLASEVASLNFIDNVDSNAATPAGYAMSQLWKMYPSETGTNYIWMDDLAVGDPIQVDDYNWQIKLREGATWQNGDPINADTWIFTFQQQLNPKLQMRMATFLYDNSVTIVNGEEYLMQGTEGYPAEVKWEDVGIKKIDDYTIQLTTEDEHNDPVTIKKHFDNRNLVPVHQGMWEECLSADGLTTSYGSDLEHFVGCGPYIFDTWEYDSIQIYKKNEAHWNADRYNFDTIEVRIVPEMNARVELFEKGEIFSFSPDANTIETYIDDPRMVSYPSVMVYDYDINVKNPENPLSGNNNFEKAMYHAMDRETIARDIYGYMEPTGTYINGMAGALSESGLCYRDSEYGKEVWDMIESWSAEGEVCGYNPELAYDYLMKAYADVGLPEDYVTTIKVMVSESAQTMQKSAELFMEQWPTIFKGKVQVETFMVASGMSLDMMEMQPESWDIVEMDWGRSLSRTLPYQVYYYHTKDYTARPTYTYTDRFEEQFAACEAVKSGDYETILQETQKLEIIALEDVITIPVVQGVNYELFADRLQLPMKQYVPGFGWGSMFGDIVE